MKKTLFCVVALIAGMHAAASMAAPAPNQPYNAQAAASLPYLVQASPAAPDAAVTAPDAAVATPKADQKADMSKGQGNHADCYFPQETGNFNGLQEYSCAFQAFRNFHIDLTDANKMAKFVKDWNPQNFADSDQLKTQESTFKLIRLMRDSLRNQEFPDHNLFDYVHTPEQVDTTQKQDVSPVLQGGIGAQVKLNNTWQIRQNVWQSRATPDAPFKSADEYRAFANKLNAAMVVGPGHELMVDAPVKGSPSFGLLKDDDFIVGVNGQSLNGMSMDAAVKLLRGDVGTSVTVQLQRRNAKGVMVSFQLTLVRSTFAQHAVTVHDINGIRHIIVANFVADNLLDDFYDALAGAKKAGMKGVDIDVRGNPGGRIDYVIAMLEMLVPRGEILKQQERVTGTDKISETHFVLNANHAFVTEAEAGASADTAEAKALVRVPYTAEYGANAAKQGFVEANPLQTVIDDDMPVTVDADGQSYSASEIFAGAMQSTHRATILGQPTPGKGVVMTELPLPDAGNVSVTSGRYFPGGLDSENIGILPDQEVAQPADFGKTDAVRDAASAEIEKLNQRNILRKKEAGERVKINIKNFNDMLDARDNADHNSAQTDSGQ